MKNERMDSSKKIVVLGYQINQESLRGFLSLYLIVSGIFGLSKLFFVLDKYQFNSLFSVWYVILPIFLLYALYIISGILLVVDRTVGYLLSKISILFQLTTFRILGLGFLCAGLGNILISYKFPFEFTIALNFGSDFLLNIYKNKDIFEFGINITSIVMFYILNRLETQKMK